jgi:hypothetical protein
MERILKQAIFQTLKSTKDFFVFIFIFDYFERKKQILALYKQFKMLPNQKFLLIHDAKY